MQMERGRPAGDTPDDAPPPPSLKKRRKNSTSDIFTPVKDFLFYSVRNANKHNTLSFYSLSVASSCFPSSKVLELKKLLYK